VSGHYSDYKSMLNALDAFEGWETLKGHLTDFFIAQSAALLIKVTIQFYTDEFPSLNIANANILLGKITIDGAPFIILKHSEPVLSTLMTVEALGGFNA